MVTMEERVPVASCGWRSGAAKRPASSRLAPTTKIYLAQKVNGAEVQRRWLIVTEGGGQTWESCSEARAHVTTDLPKGPSGDASPTSPCPSASGL